VWPVDVWQPADFQLGLVPDPSRPIDPWQERPRRRPHRAMPAAAEPDLWAEELRRPPAPRQAIEVGRMLVPPALERRLGSLRFDPQARRRPWQPLPPATRALSRARQKAARLVARLGTPRDRKVALARLTELFEEFPHPATHRALLSEVEAGLDGDTLQAMGDLKRVWLATPAWWSRRRYCPLRRRSVFTRDGQGARALSWRLARRICEARWPWPAEAMIPESWFTAWLSLPFAVHRCWSFAQFIDWRLDRDDDDGDADPTRRAPRPDPAPPGVLRWQEVAGGAGSWSDPGAARRQPGEDRRR